MTKEVIQSDLSHILELAATMPGGFRFEDLDSALGHALPKATLLRRIKLLVSAGRLRVTGAAKATRYFVVQHPPEGQEVPVELHVPLAQPASSPAGLPAAGLASTVAHSPFGAELMPPPPAVAETGLESALSHDARATRTAVRSPIQSRVPVGYDRQLLERYLPNETRYMPPDLSASLLALGRSIEFVEPRPAGTYARQILDRLLIDLSWNSSRLEGNTYSLLDTRRLLGEGIAKEGGASTESQMILNHKAAIEFLVEDAEEIGFNPYTIRNLHALISDNLLEHASDCGALRSYAVAISGSVFIPLAVPLQIVEYFELLLSKADAIRDPFEQALFVMAHLPYLQPFADGNKRTSRLAANIPFIKQNLCPLSFVDVPEREYADALIGFYELGRVDFLRDLLAWAYERSAQRYRAIRQSLGEPDPFRLRYRLQLIDVVGGLVRDGVPMAGIIAEARGRAARLVDPNDLVTFAALVAQEVASLHEGNFARFRLRPSEFRAWKAKANAPG